MSKRVLWILVLFLWVGASGQTHPGVWDTVYRFATDSADIASGKSVFQVAKTQIIVQVSKHRFGADMFEITAVDPSYPPDLLRQQAARIGELAGTPDRGLAVGKVNVGGDPKLASARATFATNGIIDRDKGTLRVSPIIQAFAGAPEPYAVHGMMILFNGERPTPNVLRSFATPGVRLQAVADVDQPSIEYRIQLLSQDPALLDVPDTARTEQKTPPIASTEQRNGVDWSLWIALFVAAIATGVLVYYLMMRASAKGRK